MEHRMWFGGFLDKRILSDPQKPGIGLHRIKFQTHERENKRML